MQMSIPITPEADHTEDEADHVEEEEEAHGKVKENQLASRILIVDKANGLPDPRIERRVLQGDRVGSKSEEGDNGWESPAKEGVRQKAEMWSLEENPRLHPSERSQHVEAHHGHPAEHGNVRKETEEANDCTDTC